MASVRLAVTSDLHLGITTEATLRALAHEVAAFAPDAFILAGDLTEQTADLGRCLAAVHAGLSCPVWVIPGNHDLWVRRGCDSRALWTERMPRLVAEAGCHWLEGTSFVIRGLGVAGTIAWYDYSAADPQIEASTLTFAQQKYNFNPDALMIDWEWTDPEFAENAAGPFLAALDRLEKDPAVRRVVVVTHMPLFEGQMCRRPENHDWAFSNAYFGNLTLGQKVLARRKVTHVLSGHTHIGRDCQIARPDGAPIEAHVLPSDYEKPAWMGLTLEMEL
jgi:hypothetical protein